MEQLLEISQVAEMVGLSQATIYQQRHRRVGIGALAISVGRLIRWRERDLEAWLDEQTAKAQAEAVG